MGHRNIRRLQACKESILLKGLDRRSKHVYCTRVLTHDPAIFCIPIICIYILLPMKPDSLPDLPCLCASLRRASRALSQLYEEALRPLGLRGSQFTILQVLSLAGEVNQGELGQMLAMDSTTLTRTLAIMSRHGWIARRPGEDRRVTMIRLSSAGKTQVERAEPYWEKVQARVKKKLGGGRWDELMIASNQVTRMVAEHNNQSSGQRA